MQESWQTLSEQELDRNPWWSHVVRRFRTPEGREGEYHFMHNNSAVNVFARLDDGRFVMIREYRYVMDRLSVATCQGGVEVEETPEQSADRELKEETGYEAATIVKIAEFASAPAFADEMIHVFLATDLKKIGEHDHEVSEVLLMNAQEIDETIRTGEIWDSHVIASWYLVKLHLKL